MHVLFTYAAPVEAGRLPIEVESFPTEPNMVEFLALGLGKSASAVTLTQRLHNSPTPQLVILFGICGAHRSAANPVDVGDLCIVSEDCFADEGVQTETGFLTPTDLGLEPSHEFHMDPHRTGLAAHALESRTVTASTVSTCSGNDRDAKARVERTGAQVETMEGAAVALACQRRKVPLVHVRCVSNRTGDRERAQWMLDGACSRIQNAVRRLIEVDWQG